MHIVPSFSDPEIARIADRLLNPTPDDLVHRERFEKLREIVENARSILAPLTETNRQLLGVYLLMACWLGEGKDYDPAPTLDPPQPQFSVVR